jgi:hypothetical protein
MRKRKVASDTGIIVLAVLAVMLVIAPSASAQPSYPANCAYLLPDSSTGAYCENNTLVQVRVNTSVPSLGGIIDISFDPNCVNITAADSSGSPWTQMGDFAHYGTYARMSSFNWPGGPTFSGDNLFANITLHCINDTSNCISYLNFSSVDIANATGLPLICTDIGLGTTHNGTITCGVVETFSKNLYEGWNLVSLPLTPEDSSTNEVLSSVSENYDAVYKYDAGSYSFVIADTMEPGTGYFINMTANDTWSYEGMSYESIDVELSQGLNMLGWLNCTKDISDALPSIENNYRYVARWNAKSQGYEVYVPGAPEVFNDFTELGRGEGYWIVAKQNCTLTGSCTS